MSISFSFRPRRRARQVRPVSVRPGVEILEDRTLPSVNLVEAEPNDSMAFANDIPRVLGTPVNVSGAVGTLGDRDWLAIPLHQGDVIGATVQGQQELNPQVQLVNSAGQQMIANDNGRAFGQYLPDQSPLPHNQTSGPNAAIYYVISTSDTYYLEVSASGDASTGKYNLDVVVARPGLEAQPVGTKQILYLDFDGATVNLARFRGSTLTGNKSLPPLAQSLPEWGLTASDENAVIDEVVAMVKEKLYSYVAANGLNGDFASTGIAGQFGIDIRNSRDDPDEYGKNPLVSRVVIGGTPEEAGLPAGILGMSEDIDVGNFKTDDESVATVDFITLGLALFPIQPPATKIDFIATGIATLVAHEAGHLFGCFHTDQNPTDPFAPGTPNLMDHYITTGLVRAIGPDGIFGTADDTSLELGVDSYSAEEVFRGVNDTLNTVAFDLSTGKQITKECRRAASRGSEKIVSSAEPFFSINPMPAGGNLTFQLAAEAGAGPTSFTVARSREDLFFSMLTSGQELSQPHDGLRHATDQNRLKNTVKSAVAPKPRLISFVAFTPELVE
jgi:hypothetical protein